MQLQPAPESLFKDIGIQCELSCFTAEPKAVTSVGKAKSVFFLNYKYSIFYNKTYREFGLYCKLFEISV